MRLKTNREPKLGYKGINNPPAPMTRRINTHSTINAQKDIHMNHKRSLMTLVAAALIVTASGCSSSSTPAQQPSSQQQPSQADQVSGQIATTAWQFMEAQWDMGDGPATFGPTFPCAPPTQGSGGETEGSCWPLYLTSFTVKHDRFLGTDVYTLVVHLSADAAYNIDEIAKDAVRVIWGDIKGPLSSDVPALLTKDVAGVQAVDAKGVHIVSSGDLDLPTK